VTPSRQNCDQGLNIKNNISISVDVFNRIFVMHFSKVALDYGVGLSRYCPTRKFLL
jgi:hypothetical protein